MVEWVSGASERTFNQSAANGSNEPISDIQACRRMEGLLGHRSQSA